MSFFSLSACSCVQHLGSCAMCRRGTLCVRCRAPGNHRCVGLAADPVRPPGVATDAWGNAQRTSVTVEYGMSSITTTVDGGGVATALNAQCRMPTSGRGSRIDVQINTGAGMPEARTETHAVNTCAGRVSISILSKYTLKNVATTSAPRSRACTAIDQT